SPELIALGAVDEARFRRLAREHAGFDVTSYTRMKSALGGYRAPDEDEAAQAARAETLDAALPSADEPELPGGTAVGVFLHEVLEHLDFALVRAMEAGADLLACAPAAALLRERARHNGVDEALLPL